MAVVMQIPTASVLLLTYNQEPYVKEALLSLLEQDYEALEIIVSDDCSSDSTWLLINEVVRGYKGNKKVILNQNLSNLGIVANYSKAFELSSGEVIFTAAGDDVSMPNRCSTCIQLWLESDRKIDLVAADAYDTLESGDVVGVKATDALETWTPEKWVLDRPYVFGASHMMTRRLVGLRPLAPSLAVEDQCFVARALMMSGAKRCPAPLVKHRRGGVSQTTSRWNYESKKSRLIASAQNGLTECEEISRDGTLLGFDMSALLKAQRGTHEFTLKVLESKNFTEIIELLVCTEQVPIRKKIKFASYVLLKPAHQFFFYLKAMKG